MDLEFEYFLMDKYIKDNGKMILQKVKEYSKLYLDLFYKDNFHHNLKYFNKMQ